MTRFDWKLLGATVRGTTAHISFYDELGVRVGTQRCHSVEAAVEAAARALDRGRVDADDRQPRDVPSPMEKAVTAIVHRNFFVRDYGFYADRPETLATVFRDRDGGVHEVTWYPNVMDGRTGQLLLAFSSVKAEGFTFGGFLVVGSREEGIRCGTKIMERDASLDHGILIDPHELWDSTPIERGVNHIDDHTLIEFNRNQAGAVIPHDCVARRLRAERTAAQERLDAATASIAKYAQELEAANTAIDQHGEIT